MTKFVEYTIKAGDTLWDISRRFEVFVDELANFNGLYGRSKHVLHIGQKIKIPQSSDSPDTLLTLRILDLAFRPIRSPHLRLKFDGVSHEVVGDADGVVGPFNVQDHATGAEIFFRNPAGEFDLIAKHESLPVGKKLLTLTSRKMLVQGRTKYDQGTGVRTTTDQKREIQRSQQAPHLPTDEADQATEPSLKPTSPKSSPVAVKAPALRPTQTVSKPSPVVRDARVEGGKPQQAIGAVFSEANLLLSPPNEKYRKHLIACASKHGLTPHTLAALINAEASKLKSGEWNANAAASSSSAAGLTQFLNVTWLQVATDKRSAVNQVLKRKNGFEQVNGQWVGKEYSIYGMKGKERIAIDTTSVLKLRFEPAYSIDAAAVYGLINLDALRKAGLNVDALRPEDMAKLMYLAHHEGAGGSESVIKGKLSEERAAELLPVQIGSSSAKKLAQRFGGKFAKAYPYWLYGYTDSKINVSHYMVNPGSLRPRSMADISAILNGVQPSRPAPKSMQTKAPPEQNKDTSTPIKGAKRLVNPLKTCVVRTAGLASVKSATFGMVRNGGTRAHQGVDLVAEVGTAVYAIADGKVIAISRAFSVTTGYGASVLLQVDVNDLPEAQRNHYRLKYPNNSLIYFYYAHLSEISVKLGPDGTLAVPAGKELGKTGDSGNAKGMTTITKGGHLHFEARHRAEKIGKGLDGRLDPLPFISSYTLPR